MPTDGAIIITQEKKGACLMTERTQLQKDMIRSNPALYRAITSCRVGRDALDGTFPPPQMATPTEYALYNLLHAIEDIATALAEKEGAE